MKMTSASEKEAFLQQTKFLAQSSGFFSVWMEVFRENEEVRHMLIAAFKGTKEEYCKDYEL